jgi:D-alanyl-D-alanine carboxypeptidase (penicillin-binding protein 5/6)
MKSSIVRALLAAVLLVLSWPAAAFETAARAAILMDYRTGDTLFEKNADEAIPPASMSKLMTAYMVFARLKEGSLTLADTLPVSEKAWRTGGSKMFVKVGDRVSVDDLLHGVIVQSGNDACIVLAEALAGSEQAFADRMTHRAAEIGLTNSVFRNATGLPDPEHRMSVRDLAILAAMIIREFPDYYHLYSEREFTYAGIRQYNRNPLLQDGVAGVDGMKTGYTEEAGYGLVVSAERDGRRLILVVAGLENARQREGEAERLLEYGFRDFLEYRLFAAGEPVVEPQVWLGAEPSVALVPEELVAITLSRPARDDLQVKLRYQEPLAAPVRAGDPLGEIEITAPGHETRSVPLVAREDVAEAGVVGRILHSLGYLVSGG